ncbi:MULTISPECIES: hypothetical protein [Burkholderia]|uniref:hypothetical protein n=1 Tax=Burkholderia TaxID=32008 RepID=UPI0012E38664|nr:MULTISPECIES: hypothetical protein [Burkholderia]
MSYVIAVTMRRARSEPHQPAARCPFPVAPRSPHVRADAFAGALQAPPAASAARRSLSMAFRISVTSAIGPPSPCTFAYDIAGANKLAASTIALTVRFIANPTLVSSVRCPSHRTHGAYVACAIREPDDSNAHKTFREQRHEQLFRYPL